MEIQVAIRTVLAFHQTVVVAVPRLGFDEINPQRLQQFRFDLIDVLAAVVGMKALYPKWEGSQYLL